MNRLIGLGLLLAGLMYPFAVYFGMAHFAPWQFALLLGSLWLVLSNFTLVTGGSATLSTVLAAIPFLGLVVGFAAWRPSRALSAN